MVVNGVLRGLVDGIVDFHNGGLVSTPVTIIGSRKNRHYLPIVLPLISLHDELVGARNEMEAVDVRKLFGNVLSKGVPGSPR